MQREIYTPPAGPPDVERPNPDIYAQMADDGIRRMIHSFYERLYASSISTLFVDDMHASADRSADYFVQILGGPDLYQQKYGHPRLRSRHTHFVITEESRQVWMGCFDATLVNASDFGFPEAHMPGFRNFLDAFSRWMVNSV
ncbi:MAG: hemoglobin [Candidatus Promineifilaceae bacterium]|jgi:hemoglobin